MKHTYLFKEGVWTARGNYYDENNDAFSAEGRCEITHQKKLWLNNSSVALSGPNPVEIINDYRIAPFVNDVTGWQAVNPKLGTLIGRFTVIEDSILSLYSSENGEYFGSESFTQIDEGEYTWKGALYSASGKIYSWSVRLEKT